MDFISTLLSSALSLALAVSVALHAFFGGVFADKQTITILPPAIVTHTNATSTSSQSIIGTTTTAKNIVPKKEKDPIASATPVVPQPPAVTPPSSPSISAEALNTQTRAALVNILCTTGGGGVHAISGSGVFIDNRGVILTNAHIGQYFLLKDYPTEDNVDCTIRTGSPAQPRYHATLLYLPPAWVAANASQLIAQQAKGTGENDYAFLLVTGTTGPDPLTTTFPTLPMTTAEPNTNDGEFLAAYPAGFLDGTTIEKSLYLTSAYAVVKDLFTFGTGRAVDLISIGGTIVSQGGSSGGAAVRTNDGKLEGIIATATAGDTTAVRDLRAITIAHIDRSLVSAGQGGIVTLLSQNLKEAAAAFAATVAPGEKDQLVKVLEHK
jgi:hypothetical protein